jgi:hypothetical protein
VRIPARKDSGLSGSDVFNLPVDVSGAVFHTIVKHALCLLADRYPAIKRKKCRSMDGDVLIRLVETVIERCSGDSEVTPIFEDVGAGA